MRWSSIWALGPALAVWVVFNLTLSRHDGGVVNAEMMSKAKKEELRCAAMGASV